MNKAIFLFVVTVVFLSQILGCTAFQRKFIRKKKPKRTAPLFYKSEEYFKKPASQLYKEHYLYWKVWHKRLAGTESRNLKADLQYASEILGHLKDMQKLVIPEKQEGLSEYIDEMERIAEQIKSGKLIVKDDRSTKIFLSRMKRKIIKEYSPAVIEEYINKE